MKQLVLFVRAGKGVKDRRTLLAEAVRCHHVVKDLRNPARSPLDRLVEQNERAT